MVAMKTQRAILTSHDRVAVAACAFAPVSSGMMQLLPAGEFHARDGRPTDAPCWRVDSSIAAALIADIEARATPLVVDYEHQSLLTAENGQPAPAAGWFKSAEWREGVGLFAAVEWTERALLHIEAGEYRYISPVITYAKDGSIKKIINAALTNNPAIDGMDEVVARLTAELNPQQETLKMDIEDLLEDLRWFFNLPTLATKEEIAATLQKAISLIKSAPAEVDAVAANSLGVVGLAQARGAELAALTVQLRTAKDELTALKTAALDKQVEDLVTTALSAHHITPAQKGDYIALGKKDVALLSSILSKAVAIVPTGEAAPAEGEGGKGTSSFLVAPGFVVDSNAAALHSKATAYAAEHKVDFLTAVKAVSDN